MNGICDPIAQKTEFEDILPLLLEELERRYKIPAKEDRLSSIIAGFLNYRQISYPPNLEHLLETNQTAAFVAGQAYHFVRKTTLKNYEFRNPVPLIYNSLDALESVPDAYVAKFLDTLCVLMTQDKKPQPNISFILEKIFPNITSEYNTVLKTIEAEIKDTHKYQKAKTTVVQGYIKLLGAVIDYAKFIVTNKHVPSTDDFQNYRRSKGLAHVLIPKT